ANESLDLTDERVKKAAAGVIASGEVTCKNFETTLLHGPGNLEAKRLLIVGGGKDKSFSSYELRRVVGAAVRALKSKAIRSFAFVLPASIPSEETAKGSAQGA